MKNMDSSLLKGVSHMKQSTVRIQEDRTVYFDPYDISEEQRDADVIFISHGHYDHFSVKDIKKVMKNDTILVLPQDCARDAGKAGFKNIMPVLPDLDYEAAGLKFGTVPAYNTNKRFHKKTSGWVGYVLNIRDIIYYFAGDTDYIPEMKNIKADVVFLPVGGVYTMDWKEAAEAANAIRPKAAVPIHFKDVVGSSDDAVNFVRGLHSGIQGVILKTQ